jgi:L-ascorbate metabolism protein UlaG (beta-lactamase superfamily)
MHRYPSLLWLCLIPVLALPGFAQSSFETDTVKTSIGDLRMTFIGHGTLMFQIGERTIHIDPVSGAADYSALPKADLVLVTHEHGDHLDPKAIDQLRTDTTTILLPAACAEKVPGATVMANGESKTVMGVVIEAVPAYNLVHERSPGVPYHPKGGGNGYVLTFGDTRVYVAGDTENTPEMKVLKDIDVAFLPMNLPYTMTPAMVADAVKAFRPRILYPYHYGETDTSELVKLLADVRGTEVRIRDLK